MADLNLMAIFARVVEAGSFSEAARRMGCSRSAVSKAVAKFEDGVLSVTIPQANKPEKGHLVDIQ